MLSVKLREQSIDLKLLDEIINRYVPSGFDIHEKAIATSNIDKVIAPIDIEKAMRSLGTLGGGNHFIEVDRDSNGDLWLVIHTGSRHLGIEVCVHYQSIGYKKIKTERNHDEIETVIERLKSEGRQKEIENTIKVIKSKEPSIPKDLCYIEGSDFDNYLHDMAIVQEHAAINRKTIADQIVHRMNLHVSDSFQTIHNYIDVDNKILRKGSVSAYNGEKLIIPMNMRDGSLICIGKGNPDWNYSAPHGAGRIMSRSYAKDNISMDEFKDSMKGIYSTSIVESTIDESPMAYKPMDEIIKNTRDTVDIVDIIKPIYNFKAH